MKFPKKLYKFIKFQKSNAKNKKYSAILKNKDTGRTIAINFGDTRYQQYKDSTGLGLYSHLDHIDKERRSRYRSRHKVHLKPGYYSPAYFSYRYLW